MAGSLGHLHVLSLRLGRTVLGNFFLELTWQVAYLRCKDEREEISASPISKWERSSFSFKSSQGSKPSALSDAGFDSTEVRSALELSPQPIRRM
jgi:hypothetical protein